MASGVTGYFDLKGGAGITLRIHYSESYTVENNQSTVSITKIEVKSSDYYGVTYYLDGSITIAGTTAISMSSSGGTHPVTLSALNTFYTSGGTMGAVEVSHEADGSKSVAIAVSVRGYTISGGAGSGWSASDSQTVTLTTIPRASTVSLSAGTVQMGSQVGIYIARAASTFTHTLRYTFGSASGVIGEKVQTSALWTVPLELAKQIPESTTGKGTITCITYQAGQEIGRSSVSFTATVPNSDETKPRITMTLSPVSSLPDAFAGLYIQGQTKVRAILSGTSEFSEIAGYSMRVGGVTYAGADTTSAVLDTSGTVEVAGTVTDKRGFAASVSQKIQVISYAKPRVAAYKGESAPICARCDEAGILSESGVYLLIRVGRSYSRVTANGVQNNFCALKYRYKATTGSSWSGWTALLDSSDTGSDSAQIILPNFSKNTSYTVELMAVDTIGNTGTCLRQVGTAVAALHLGAGGNKVGIGKYAENPGLDMGFDIYMNGKVIHDMAPESLLDLVYPVGSIYLAYNHTSPASLFGGTWTRIENRFLLAANSSGKIGSTGGESNHILTVNEIPLHKHDVNVYYDYPASTTVPATYGMISLANLNWSASERSGKHYAGYGFTSTEGGGKSHNNLPPYIQVSVWRRTA